jgi:hypothetical protein
MAKPDPYAYGEVASEASYSARILCDGEELKLPFVLYADRDYQIGDYLEAIADNKASSLLAIRPIVALDHIEVILYVPAATDCFGDADPMELASARVYRM